MQAVNRHIVSGQQLENLDGKTYLRPQQRREKLVRRKTFYDNLMENLSSDKFYKPIKTNKSAKEASSAVLVFKLKNANTSIICFAKYFEDMPTDRNYDSMFLELCNIHVRCDEVLLQLDFKWLQLD